MGPEVILADEPTGNLDWDMSLRLLTLLVELNKMGKTVLVATLILMGGATFAHGLAQRGIDVLVLERGHRLPKEPENTSPEAVFVHRRYKPDDTWYSVDGTPFAPGVHYVVGGNTKVYGSSLPRLRERPPTGKSRLSIMSNSQWSNEQPPAWQGPNAPSFKSEPPTPISGWKKERLSVLLGLTWGLFSKNAKTFLVGNIVAVGIGAIVTLAFLRAFPVELSAISQALLNGDPKPLDDAIAAAKTIEEQSQVTLDAILPVLKMLALTFPFIAITSDRKSVV